MTDIKQFVTVFENQNKGLIVQKAYDMNKWVLFAVSKKDQLEPSFDTPLYAMDKRTQAVSTFTPTEHFDMYTKAIENEIYSK